MRVVQTTAMHLAHGWEAGEIHRQHPHMSLPAIHSALAYFYDHKGELERQIADDMEAVDRIRETSPPPPFTKSQLETRLQNKAGRPV
jgi:hypothetical protein